MKTFHFNSVIIIIKVKYLFYLQLCDAGYGVFVADFDKHI